MSDLNFLVMRCLNLQSAIASIDLYPDIPEGGLTRIRAEVVCEKGLARIARRLKLGAGLASGAGGREVWRAG